MCRALAIRPPTSTAPSPEQGREAGDRHPLDRPRRDRGALRGAIGVSGDILLHQPAFQFGQSYYTINAQFSTAAAVTAGQGQAVAIAGVQVGQVGGVHLQDGRAVVTMNIDKQYAPIYRYATVLLRPRTPLKDMYLALDPGSRAAGRVPAGGTIGPANTTPDVNLSEILSSLDADTRNYLLLLLSGARRSSTIPPARPAPHQPPRRSWRCARP